MLRGRLKILSMTRNLAIASTGELVLLGAGCAWDMVSTRDAKSGKVLRGGGLSFTGIQLGCRLELDCFTASRNVNRDLLGRFALGCTSSEDSKCKAITSQEALTEFKRNQNSTLSNS